jgi:hypothetical protein
MTGMFTPTTARDLHRSLIEWWASAEAAQYADARADFAAEQAERPAETRVMYYTEVNPEAERRRLRVAETYLITDEMSAVCRHASAGLPPVTVEHHLLPAEIGFAVFNDRLSDHDPKIGSAIPLEVACWYPAEYAGQAGVAVCTYISRDTVETIGPGKGWVLAAWRTPILPGLWTFLPYGQLVPEVGRYDEDNPEYVAFKDAETRNVVRMLLATWLLMAQPIAARELPRIERKAARRASRTGLLSDLTVITLRRPRGAPEAAGGREYSRRWIVRGHWRRVPTPELPHRVTWVHGYVKGPANAPLVVTDRVTVLAR